MVTYKSGKVILPKKSRYTFKIILIVFVGNPLLLNAQKQTLWLNLINRLRLELQDNSTYDHNNFYINQYKNYFIQQFNSDLSLHVLKMNNGPVIEPYLKFSYIKDCINKPWNTFDWHNNVVKGYGGRVRYSLKSIGFINNKICPEIFNIDMFAEKLSVNYLEKTNLQVSFRPQDDFKAGIQYLLELGSKKKSDNSGFYNRILNHFWIESAGSYIYSKSDFFVESEENFYLLSFENKIGMRIRPLEKLFLEPYLHNLMVYDTGNELWNRFEWHNNVKNGVGFRLSCLPKLNSDQKYFYVSFNLFAEYLWIKYFNSTIYIPSYKPTKNWLAGINIWLTLKGNR
jgi:hypothetical protein